MSWVLWSLLSFWIIFEAQVWVFVLFWSSIVFYFLRGFRLLSIIISIIFHNCAWYSGLGPGTLVGSAAFDLFPIHAVCVVIPKAGELKKIADLGVWIVELFWSFWAYFWLYIILEVELQHSFVLNIINCFLPFHFDWLIYERVRAIIWAFISHKKPSLLRNCNWFIAKFRER